MLTAEMLSAKRMRLLCGLRQIDVWAGTGISLGRLSQAETGRISLTDSEMAGLVSFLRKQWELCQQAEKEIFDTAARGSAAEYITA
jgi:hypothetical protein